MAKENWATVKDVAEWFNKLVAEGKGDYFVDVDDNFGGNYGLDKGERYGYVDDKIKNVSIGDFYEHIEVKGDLQNGQNTSQTVETYSAEEGSED